MIRTFEISSAERETDIIASPYSTYLYENASKIVYYPYDPLPVIWVRYTDSVEVAWTSLNRHMEDVKKDIISNLKDADINVGNTWELYDSKRKEYVKKNSFFSRIPLYGVRKNLAINEDTERIIFITDCEPAYLIYAAVTTKLVSFTGRDMSLPGKRLVLACVSNSYGVSKPDTSFHPLVSSKPKPGRSDFAHLPHLLGKSTEKIREVAARAITGTTQKSPKAHQEILFSSIIEEGGIPLCVDLGENEEVEVLLDIKSIATKEHEIVIERALISYEGLKLKVGKKLSPDETVEILEGLDLAIPVTFI